jgi:hypothetical protein
MVGDAGIAAFFSAGQAEKREEVRGGDTCPLVEADLKIEGFLSVDGELDLAIKDLGKGSRGIVAISLGTRVS